MTSCMLQEHKLRRLWLGWRVDCESHSIDVLRVHGGIEFCRPGHWSGGPFPSPGDLPNPGIEPRTQELNPGFLHCRQILYQLNHKGNPRILEWVAFPFPGGLPNPGIKPGSPALQEDSLPTELSYSHKRET